MGQLPQVCTPRRKSSMILVESFTQLAASLRGSLRQLFATRTIASPAQAEQQLAEQLEIAADEARQANARLRDAIDILPNGLVFLDAEGRYILWNQQYA